MGISADRQRRSKAPRAFGSLVALVALALAVFMTAQPALAGVANQGALGTPGNPLKMAFVPSADSQKVLGSGQPLADLLSQQTGLSFSVSVPTSYAAVVEAMGANNVDVGWLAPFAYVLAHDKFQSTVILASVRGGSKTYTGQIITGVDSGINSVADLPGHKFAFVDPSSASGFLYPNAMLKGQGIDYKTAFSETVFAGGHDKVVIAVYNKQVDGGATFGNNVDNGPPTDARTLVTSTLPDVMSVVKPIAQTDPIPNDTVSVRKGLDDNVVKLLSDGLLYVQSTADGKKALKDLYGIDGLGPADDKDYDSIRTAAKALNLDLEQQIAPPKPG
jgi:phosphonate transport system substrate-binding protein